MGNRQIERDRIGGLGLRGTGPRELAGRRCGGAGHNYVHDRPIHGVSRTAVNGSDALSSPRTGAVVLRTPGQERAGLRLPGARRGARLCAQSLRAARTSVAGSRPRPAARPGGKPGG